MYKHGFYEFEPLIPIINSKKVFKKIIELSHRYNCPPYIGGIKYHKGDDFLLSFGLNGFSIGFDFPILKSKYNEQIEMLNLMHEITLENGGLVYLAKDNMMKDEHFKGMYNKKLIKFLKVKEKYDSDNFFSSKLFRRLFL